MNNRYYRLVFSKLRGMLIAVAETAVGQGKASQGETGPSVALQSFTLFAMRHAAFAALAIFGFAPVTSYGQIVPGGAHAPGVISTANGLPQVNVNRPSNAGVSVNTYSQFDVQKNGAILNNSPVNTNTQLAGQISGNPNFGPNNAAKIIVNQVNSNNASLLRGYVEVAGKKADVIISNASGLVVDGGGFINTARGILTTGNPLIDGNGNLTGFSVTGGMITVQGAGLNTSNIDEVDLLSRALQVNAAIYGKSMHVVTGANNIDYTSLIPTPIAGSGPAPGVSIDVSQLGGMYSNRIVLVGTENGVGVANAGTIAAQAGDLILTSAGQLVQSGTMNASGNLGINAAGVANSGTIYAQGNTSIGTAGAVTNSGTVAAQQNTSITAGSVASTGTLGAGVNGDGSVGSSGDLLLSASGQLDASGLNMAGGNATLSGSGVNLAGSVTAANGNMALAAYAGDVNLAGAITSAAGAVNAQAAGALVNDRGTLTAGGSMTLDAGSLSNRNGGVSSQGALVAQTSGQIANQGGEMISQGAMQVRGADISNNQGAMQGAGGVLVAGASLDNSAGRITSLSADGLSVTTTGQLLNTAGTTAGGAQGGVIGGNGTVTLQGGSIVNQGTVSAQTDLQLDAQSLNNDAGTLQAQNNAAINAGAQLTDNGGVIVAGQRAAVSATTLDNSGGVTQAAQLSLDATNLLNHAGTVTQTGTSAMTVAVSGTLDNSAGGKIQTNSTDLTLAPAVLKNDDGTITHAGTGTLAIDPGNGSGSFSNAGGTVITAGQLSVHAGSLNNQAGALAAMGAIAASVAGDVNNTQGAVRSLSSISLASGGALTDTGGQIQSGTGAAGDASLLSVQAASIDSSNGLIGNLGTGDTTVQGGSQIVNSGGLIAGNGSVKLGASSISNTQGGQVSGANVAIQTSTLDDTGGKIGTFAGSGGDVVISATGAVSNTNGQIGADHDLLLTAATLTGGGAYSAANDVAVNVQGNFAPTPDMQFMAGHDLTFTLPGTFSNSGSLDAVDNLAINANDIANSGAMMAGGTLTTHSNTLANTGAIVGGSVSLNATSSISNVGPTALIGATDSNGTLELLAPDIENRDDTTATDTQATTAIYGLGKVVLAGGKDANGNYTNANLIRNQSALIQSAGDMTLDANQVTNTRTTMTTTGLNQSVDPGLLAELGISLSGCTAVNMAACSGQDVGWTTPDNPAFLTMIGGAYTVPPHGGQWNSGYQYTTYTGAAVANLIASISPQAQIIAGGNLDASNTGLFQNYWSAVAAAGNIAMPVSLDADSWRGQLAPEVQVTYSGYYHYNNYDNSEHNWTLPFGNAPFVGSNPGGYQVAPANVHDYGLPDYESTWTAGGTISGTGVSVNNTAGNAGIPSLGLVPGQSVSGVNVGGIGGSAVQVDPPIARATAVNVLSNLTIPHGGLFKPDTAPNAPYLIESNPAFTNAKSFISSDYYLKQLGLNPQTVEKRLGDGLYEQQLVQNQITSLTGKAVLGPYTNVQSMYEALMAAGASLAGSLQLPLGMSLSPDQVAALTSNVIIMQTEVVDGQSVLVPVVYLAKASQQDMNGPLIAATNIDLQNARNFNNSGTVQAGNTLSIQGQQISNAFGTLQSGGLMSLATTGNVDLSSATVNAGSLALNAGGDLILNTAANTVHQVSATGATRTTTTLGPIASLNVAGDAAIVTGGNFEQNGANLNVGGNLGMAVGGNYDIGAVQTGEQKVVHGANGVSDTNLNSANGSSVNVGGVSQIGVGGNLTATGANINLAGGGTVVAKGDVTLQAAKTTSTVDSNSSLSDSHRSNSESLHTSVDTLTATTLNAGNSLTVASGNDINVTGSTISLDQGTATLAAANNVNIGAATATYVDNFQGQHSHSNVVSGKEVSSSRDTTTTLSQGSMISADAVSISGGKDINVAGSTIVGTNDVSLAAVHDVNITTTQDTSQSSSFYEEKKSGFGAMSGGGVSLNYGNSDTKQTTHDSSVTNNGSLVGSTNGNLSIQAGDTLHVTGSDLVAARNVTGTAANVVIDAAISTSHQDDTQETKQSGFTLGLSGSVGDAINGAVAQGQALASGNSNGRAEALNAIAAGGNAAMAGMGAADVMGGATGPNAPSIGVKLSFGSSQSRNTFTEDQTTQKGSNIQAGGTAAFVATGGGDNAGTPGSGNLTIAGSNVSANDVLLAAKDKVNIVNTTNTDTTASTNKSSSASVGVSYGTQGFGVSASMSNAHGDGNSNAAIQNASHVSGANGVTVVSGGDTNIIGSQVSGGQVTASVGGNLNIQSVQDTTVSTAHQSSAGGGFSISQGGGSASFSAQNGHADSDYAQVNEQAGIQAGKGGFDINVEGNTDLTGAVISSTADASQNSLTTGTLTYSDIQNQSHYSASSNGIGAGVGVGNTGKATGPGSVSGTPGITPMISQNENGDDSATTRSAVSAGALNITDGAKQTQDVASLSRDTTDTNGTVSNTPDVNALLSQQADTMQAAQAAGQVVAQGIGLYADKKEEAALKTGDPETAAAWAEGGDNRALLHAAGGALIGGLGGGSVFGAIGGAAGAGLSSKLAGQLVSLSKGVASDTGSDLLGNLAANVAAGVSGALVGGTAGAATASNVELYNQMLHQKKDLVSQVCGAGAQCSDATLSAAIQAQGANADAAAGTLQPNYATLNFGVLSGAAGGAINLYDGTKYLAFGVAQGNPASTNWSLGASATVGWIFGANNAASTNNFMNGDGNQAFISIPTPLPFNIVGAVTHGYGGATAVEVGVGTPGDKISYGVIPWSHSMPVGKSAQ
ncbi:hemagglutinin repeat-containing protein (plasmid) [Paraburkholderia sprentiae WSM5005]|uniref:Hemagglutinin repeat-containing protein n=1 Tax=Paraburkholderia sprentiae WSM5005 TaxID=754502 RepID=A0A1I9YUD8_9BURK|nr:hemagglutinin repeat-containing protein [Paraburkholderia sprentiae]APA89826.2 hemagglutinin repeat-containing protein [Paraburkholderia sprentiae WSM5005]